MTVLIKVGEVIDIKEADYCFGLGILNLRVT